MIRIKIIKRIKNCEIISLKRSTRGIEKDIKDGEKSINLSQKEIEEIENSLK